jgi:hypothetical protein
MAEPKILPKQIELEIVEDVAPQLGGDLDTNANDIKFDDGKGILDDSGNEQLLFGKTASATTYAKITNNINGSGVKLEVAGGGTNEDLILNSKGTGVLSVAGTTTYEDNVTSDDDIPNKKYVDDLANFDTHKFTASGDWEPKDFTAEGDTNVQVAIDCEDTIGSGIELYDDTTLLATVNAGDTKAFVKEIAGQLKLTAISGTGDITDGSYTGNFKLVSSQMGTPVKVFFNPSGTKMYVLGFTNKYVYQYSLGNPWEVSTASYDNVFLYVGTQEASPFGMTFKPDGTKAYIIGYGSDTVYQYGLTRAWDIGSGSYDTVLKSVASQAIIPASVFFKPDGTRMYILNNYNQYVYQYSMSTAWDLANASYNSKSFHVGGEASNPYTAIINLAGTKMFIMDASSKKVHQYTLSTPWDVSTASYDTEALDVSGQDSIPYGLFINNTEDRMYIAGSTGDKVYQYSLDNDFAGTGFVSINYKL